MNGLSLLCWPAEPTLKQRDAFLFDLRFGFWRVHRLLSLACNVDVQHKRRLGDSKAQSAQVSEWSVSALGTQVPSLAPSPRQTLKII